MPRSDEITAQLLQTSLLATSPWIWAIRTPNDRCKIDFPKFKLNFDIHGVYFYILLPMLKLMLALRFIFDFDWKRTWRCCQHDLMVFSVLIRHATYRHRHSLFSANNSLEMGWGLCVWRRTPTSKLKLSLSLSSVKGLSSSHQTSIHIFSLRFYHFSVQWEGRRSMVYDCQSKNRTNIGNWQVQRFFRVGCGLEGTFRISRLASANFAFVFYFCLGLLFANTKKFLQYLYIPPNEMRQQKSPPKTRHHLIW